MDNKMLADVSCVPCLSTAQALTVIECTQLLSQLIGWNIKTGDGSQVACPKLTKTYRFTNFSSALEFANCVGELAEKQDHHPSLLVEWGSVEVSWWTHSISGLHQNDFIMAAKLDAL